MLHLRGVNSYQSTKKPINKSINTPISYKKTFNDNNIGYVLKNQTFMGLGLKTFFSFKVNMDLLNEYLRFYNKYEAFFVFDKIKFDSNIKDFNKVEFWHDRRNMKVELGTQKGFDFNVAVKAEVDLKNGKLTYKSTGNNNYNSYTVRYNINRALEQAINSYKDLENGGPTIDEDCILVPSRA